MQNNKIFLILPHTRFGGAEKVTKAIFEYLRKEKKITAKLIILDSAVKNEESVVSLGQKRLRQAILPLIKLIKNEKPEVLFSSFGYITILLCILKFFFQFKLIARESNTLSEKLKEFSWLRKTFYKLAYYFLYKKCDVIIVQSKVMNNDLKQYLARSSQEKMITVNNFIETALDENKISQPINNPITKRLMAIGRLEHQKGFDLLIQEVSKLDIELDIFGSGSQRENLQNLIEINQASHKIRLRGEHSNLQSQFKNYHYLIISSRYEGFSNVMLEALACGLPVIAKNNVGGVEETIKNSFNGFIYDSVRFSLKDILNNNYMFDYLKITTDVNEKFNAEKTLQLYQKIICDI